MYKHRMLLKFPPWCVRIALRKSIHDRVAASRILKTGLPEYIGREVMFMTAADIILIFIGIIGLLISFGSLIVALLTFLDKRNKHKK